MPLDDPHSYELLIDTSEKELQQLVPVTFEADEALSTPFRVIIEAQTRDPIDPSAIDAGAWLRKKLAVGIARTADPSWFHGHIVAVEHLGGDDKHYQTYRLEIAPALALLQHNRRTRVFTDMTPLDVVASVLQEGSVAIEMKAEGAGGTMRHITQFEESDFAFVSRLLEQEGACYWFTHAKSAHTMVIGDAATHHPGSDAALHATIATASKMAAASEGMVLSLALRYEVVPKDAQVRDYSEGHPKQPALGQKTVLADRTPGAVGRHHEADYHVTQTDADAGAYAARLAESFTARSSRVVGASGIVAFRSGVRAAVHGRDGYDEHMLLNRVRHTLRDRTYRNEFDAVPVSRLPWRPPRRTPIPRIDGVVPAVVTAAAGAQGQGEDGSYRVRILNSDDKADRIVRMAQPYAGASHGFHFPLHIDTEVLLAHEYGHPDRPIITGAMHNAEDPSQVVEANKSQCVMRSAANASLVFEDVVDAEWVRLTSKSGNQLSFEDAKGSELVKLTAVKDLTVEVAKREARTIGGDKTESITGSLTVEIGKDATSTIKGNRTDSLEGDHTGSVGGNDSLSIGGDATATISGSLAASITKDVSLTTDAKLICSASQDVSVSTDAAMSLTVAKKTTLKSAGVVVDSDGDVVITAGQASITLKKSGDIVIKGSKVKIEGTGDVVVKGSKLAAN